MNNIIKSKYKVSNKLINKIIRKAPTYISGGKYSLRSYGYDDEYSTSYKSVIIYIQNGLNNNHELFKEIFKAIIKIQKGGNRKYQLLVFGFGDTDKLQHENKFFDFGYINDKYNIDKVIETISRLSGSQVIKEIAIIPELFPKTDARSLYTGKIKVDDQDLLIIIGNKEKTIFAEKLKRKLKMSIRKHIMFADINSIFTKVEYTFGNYKPTFMS